MREQRSKLPLEVAKRAVSQIFQFILHQPWFQDNQCFAFYQAMPGEISLTDLIQAAWKMKKTCCLPVCQPDDTLSFVPYCSGESLLPNRYGILEPSPGVHLPVKINDIDVIFLPLLAFDALGNRLGFGKGYYDRTLARLIMQKSHHPLLIGLAYEFQRQKEGLETKYWDIPLDQVVIYDTEQDKTYQWICGSNQ